MVTKYEKEKKSDFLSIRVAPHIKNKLLKIGKKKDRSLSWIIGKIIENYLKSHDGEDL